MKSVGRFILEDYAIWWDGMKIWEVYCL